MKHAFYSKIAFGNIIKNRRFFLPQILTAAGLQGVFYIMLTIINDENLRKIRGGSYLPALMSIGLVVMTVLSSILLIYTSRFLMKQRKREFGLYTVLGMEKRHVGRILFFEMLFSNGASLFLGMFFGVLMYKFCTLFLCRLLQIPTILGFRYLFSGTVFLTALVFLVMELGVFLLNYGSILLLKPVELLRSRHEGEKEPKTKLLIFFPGLFSLGAGYYLALVTRNPIDAIGVFLIAVLLVMLGTYCLFVSGSIFVLQLLKKNKTYYYNPRHMASVSGLLYRMKQNAVGLASIAILSTGVLIMLSTSMSLYAGMEDTIREAFAEDASVIAYSVNEKGEKIPIPDQEFRKLAEEAAKEAGIELTSVKREHYLEVCYGIEGNSLVPLDGNLKTQSFSTVKSFLVLTAKEYETLTGERCMLTDGEVLLYRMRKQLDFGSALTIAGKTFQVKNELKEFPIRNGINIYGGTYGLVVSDETVTQWLLNTAGDQAQELESKFTEKMSIFVNTKSVKEEEGIAFTRILDERCRSFLRDTAGEAAYRYVDVSSKWDTRESLLNLNGSLLFLGLLLGIIFLFATMLIIYYKQISEGYEDRERFQIMQKVGMSADEVRQTIRHQLVVVFFLPVLVAAIHLAVAFPILNTMLHLFLLSDTMLFVKFTLLTFAVFALIYLAIYFLTARVYYRIVH